MAVIKAKKIPQKEISTVDIISRFCYYFPQYTYFQATKLPYKRVAIMLKTADKERARNMLDLLSIISSVNAKNPNEAIKGLRTYFEEFLSR